MILDLLTLKQAFNLPDYPVAITASAGVASITLTNHNFKTGDYVTITGTTKFNGKQLVTRQNPNTLTFPTTETGSENGVIKQWDDVLNGIINRVEGEISAYCNMIFGKTASASELYDLNVDGIIYQKRGPIEDASVTEIKLSKVNDFTTAGAFILLTPADYFLYEDRIELNIAKAYEYLACKRAVKLTYTTLEAPEKIKSVAMVMAEYFWRVYNSKSIHITGESLNGEQRTWKDTLPQSVITDLEMFKRMMIGKSI